MNKKLFILITLPTILFSTTYLRRTITRTAQFSNQTKSTIWLKVYKVNKDYSNTTQYESRTSNVGLTEILSNQSSIIKYKTTGGITSIFVASTDKKKLPAFKRGGSFPKSGNNPTTIKGPITSGKNFLIKRNESGNLEFEIIN